jgi:hypothetical protein
MKTVRNSQAGFVQLTLVFAGIILLLCGLGVQGIYTALKNRNPISMSCEDYARTKPKTAWLAITNCVLDLNDACYATLKYQNVEVPTELFIPVRSANSKERMKDNILLATRDPELMKTLRELESLPSKAKLEAWLTRNANRLLVHRDVKGLVQFGVEMKTQERRKIAQLQENLTPDFIILDEGKKPELKHSIGFLALAAVLTVISIVFFKRSNREPDPAETY